MEALTEEDVIFFTNFLGKLLHIVTKCKQSSSKDIDDCNDLVNAINEKKVKIKHLINLSYFSENLKICTCDRTCHSQYDHEEYEKFMEILKKIKT